MTPIDRLVHELAKLPGIGERTATRLAFFILRQPGEYARSLSQAVSDVKERVRLCSECMDLTEADPCATCRDPRREKDVICVVEEPSDVLAVERTHAFRGRYHILGGALDPLSGIGPEQLRIRELLNRVGERVDGVDVTEVIIATDPNTEGEATATYLVRILRDIPELTVTRIASGLPMGGDLEFADELTLGRAFAGRRAMV